jgi:MYXO-CTERM domain-containing protein
MTAADRRRRAPLGRFAAGGLAMAAALMGPATPSALAYIQYQVVDQTTQQPTGVYISWNRNCVDITAYPNDLTDMTYDQVTNAASAAAATWSKVSLPCTYLNLKVTPSMQPKRAAGSDAYNVLIFRNPWCDPANPDQCQPEALAVTSVFAGRTSGIIHDADIEVNTENFLWGDLAAQPAVGRQDLQNALTHEMGHLIGLDHNCFTPGSDPYRQNDNTGAPAPFCAAADPVVQAATMYTKAEFGDLSKRTLSDDDQNAVCQIYPVASDPNYCPPPATEPIGCGCEVSGGSGAAGGLALAVLGLVSALALRRRRRTTSTS